MRASTVVRRVHQYLGLLLLPWLLLFGASGVLFNHPNLGESTRGRFIPPKELSESTGIGPWDARALAEHLTRELSAQGSRRFSLDDDFGPRFTGYGIFRAPQADGQTTLIFEPNRGAAILSERSARPEPRPLPLDPIPMSEYAPATLEGKLAGLRRDDQRGPLLTHPEAAPRLEFRVSDGDGETWNVEYSTRDGSLKARRSDVFPSIGVSQFLTTLHTTHHFTIGLSARWFWALFQDLLGCAMVVWALTGAYLWWLNRPSRVVGTFALALAVGVATWITVATSRDVFFGPVRQTLGPGN